LEVWNIFITFAVGKQRRKQVDFSATSKHKKSGDLSQATTFTNYDKNKINFSLKIGESILPSKRTLNAN
jgi:hypothetical protein